jgi:hypothetical protein
VDEERDEEGREAEEQCVDGKAQKGADHLHSIESDFLGRKTAGHRC